MTPIHLIGSTFCVEIPDDLQGRAPQYHFQPSIDDLMHERKGDSELIISFERKTCGLPRTKVSVNLPNTGNWQIICTTKEVTEEVAAGIVQVISNGKIIGRLQYRRYDRDPVKDTPAKCWTRDPRHALETLLTSKGLDVNKNYVLIKKIA